MVSRVGLRLMRRKALRFSALRDHLKEAAMLRERLACYAHTAWSGWMVYLFSKIRRNDDGSFTIPSDLAARWSRQLNTGYDSLPEDEKGSDRKQADLMIEIVEREGAHHSHIKLTDK